MSCKDRLPQTCLYGFSHPNIRLPERAIESLSEQLGPRLAVRLASCEHGFQGAPNPYHLEGDVLRHTAMAVDRAEAILARVPIPEPWAGALRRTAIGHDLGKPDARQDDAETQKTRFTGHPSWSALRALDWLDERGELEFLHQSGTLYPTLAAIALHDAALSDLYGGGAADKARERWARVLAYNPDLAWLLPAINLADDLGRIRGEGGGNSPNPCYDLLAARMKEFPPPPGLPEGGTFASITERPTLVVMVGLPGCGKSTLARRLAEMAGEGDTYTTGLDPAVHALARERGMSYQDVHADAELMGLADKRSQEELVERLADSAPRLVIADRTHLGAKSRSRTLARWDQALNQARKRRGDLHAYQVIALQVLSPYEMAVQRSLARPHQSVSRDVFREMVFRYTPPVYGEGTASGRNLQPWVYDGIVYAVQRPNDGGTIIGQYRPPATHREWLDDVIELCASRR